MLTLTLTVLAASVLGSLHCVGMCGPFLAFAVTSAPGAPRQHARLQLAYHAGRGCSYVLLGVAAGALGAALDLSGGFLGLNGVAASLAGAVMVVFGAASLLQILGFKVPSAPIPPLARKLAMRAHVRVLHLAAPVRAYLIGLLTTLLPCGWLYAFAFTAAGTASPAWGALVMAAFWVGTLPALSIIGAGVQTLVGALAPRIPLVTALVLLSAGLYTLSGRASLAPAAIATAVSPRAVHKTSVSNSTTINQLASEQMPCCGRHGD